MTSRAHLESAVLTGMARAGQDVMRWGRDDCALWTSDAVRAALGYDPAAPWRGRYKTRAGALRVLGPKGILGAMRAAARRHKWKRISPAMAQPGDMGLAWTEVHGRLVLATVICRARGWFVGRNERGWTAMRAEHVAGAWSVLPDWQPGARASLGKISSRPQLVRTSAVAHEPVSAIIGLTAFITSLGVSATVAAAVGGFIVTTAISVAFSLVASLLMPHAGIGALDNSGAGTLSDTSQASAVQVTERQSLPFKRVVVGAAYVGGPLFFEQVKAPYLTMGVLLNYGQITGIDKVYIGTNQLAFTSIVPNTVLTPIRVVDQPDYPNRLKVSFRYGASDQAVDPLIVQDYTDIGSEFRQRGIATAVYRYSFGADQTEYTALWGQVARPNAYQVVRGAAVYDPRDATQSLTDETTWKWTNNATLVQAWYLTRSWGGRIPTSKMRWDKIAESADYDDSLFGCKDGTLIARHTIDGVITLNQRPFDVMQTLLTANRATILESAGRVWVQSSKPKAPVATIHDRILASGIKYQSAKAKRDLVNKLQVRFVAPDQDYQVVDGPILSRTDLQTADQEVLPATLALNYTLDHRRAQRLQKAFLDSSRLGRTITCSVDTTFMAAAADELVGNVVTVDSQLFSFANGTYLITSVGFADDCTTLSLALTEYDPTIETSWNASTDEQDFVLADPNVS